MGDLCKTMRETNPKTIKKINFNSKNNGKNIFFDNNFNKILNKFNFSRCEEDDSINTNMVNTYRENMKIRNLLLEYSGIKPNVARVSILDETIDQINDIIKHVKSDEVFSGSEFTKGNIDKLV